MVSEMITWFPLLDSEFDSNSVLETAENDEKIN